ncbi:MAG TPA: DUF4339 domain-containing protein [Alphaproteobacteria bacterium]|nr:DUF4339 domain-containing protein [Alphaproteobacteria bacterium]
MANYIIIGGDGKQYGPIAEGDLRKWIAEGRLNAQSLAKSESDAEFRPLGTFPELADAFAAPAAPPSIAPVLPVATAADSRAALDKVKIPAIGLMISAIVSIVCILIEIFARQALLRQMASWLEQMSGGAQTQSIQQMENTPVGPVAIGSYVFQIIIAILILIGAMRMIKLRSYEFSFAAAIMCVIPCITISCCASPLGLIFGIWAMVVLVKAKPYFT